MFTGLIESLGKIDTVRRHGNDMVLIISPVSRMTDVSVGDSISVNGVCLTVTSLSQGLLSMDVSSETLLRSTLKFLRQGDEVNLERALRLKDRIGGHLVSGHVDGIGKIIKKEPRQRYWLIKISVDERISRYIILKGSISVDGISLTINNCDKNSFEVNIIPQTGKETTLIKKKVGDPVNIETDLIGKYVENFVLRERPARNKDLQSGIDLGMLIKHGFGD
ncbi:MAG: riboflavin synthase [Deltaproteobacteria bacterium]|nr:riboflavin synthase [Deltaproteobacteria bacterium]